MPSITGGVHAGGAYCLEQGLTEQLHQLQTELAEATAPDRKIQLGLEIDQVKLRQRDLRKWFDWCLF